LFPFANVGALCGSQGLLRRPAAVVNVGRAQAVDEASGTEQQARQQPNAWFP